MRAAVPTARRPVGRGMRVGLALILLAAVPAALSLVWTPHDPLALNIPARLLPPSPAHWAGTDAFGRDVASLVMTGLANSLGIALAAVALGLGLGVPAGLAAAGLRGPAEGAVMRAADLVFAFPALLTAAVLTANIGPGATTVVLAVGLFNAAVLARVTHGAALQIAGRPFVTAARAMGRAPLSLAARHILPNIAPILLVQATVQLAIAILAEASLSYIGFGLQPPAPSLGRMLAESQTRLASAPHLALAPGLAIAVAVLGLNLVGDGLRDWLDPRLRRLSPAGT